MVDIYIIEIDGKIDRQIGNASWVISSDICVIIIPMHTIIGRLMILVVISTCIANSNELVAVRGAARESDGAGGPRQGTSSALPPQRD